VNAERLVSATFWPNQQIGGLIGLADWRIDRIDGLIGLIGLTDWRIDRIDGLTN
jgi:hypothetical protein